MSQVLRKARAMADGPAIVWEARTSSAFARRAVDLVCHCTSYVVQYIVELLITLLLKWQSQIFMKALDWIVIGS